MPVVAGSHGERILFKAPAKWEQNVFCHSPGYAQLSDSAIEFIPHSSLSLVGKHILIPIGLVAEVTEGDNFLWRCVVYAKLKEPVLGRFQYKFFLGAKCKEFLALVEDVIKDFNLEAQSNGNDPITPHFPDGPVFRPWQSEEWCPRGRSGRVSGVRSGDVQWEKPAMGL